MNVAILFVMFIGFFSLSSQTGNMADPAYYLGYVFWLYANNVISESSVSISSEKQSGTFEQLLIKPTSLVTILSFRTVCWFLLTTLEIIGVLAVMHMVFRLPIGFHVLVIPVFLITMLGLMGLSFLLSALTLIYTKTASFSSILSYVLLFFTGAIYGNPSKNFAYYVFPLSQGIEISRSLVNGLSVTCNDVIILVLNSIAYLLAGLFLFRMVMKQGLQNGISSKY